MAGEGGRSSELTLNSQPSTINQRNGFDLLIGNPPYIRIQSLKQSAPHLVEHYKRRYQAASKGNFDLYVVFVERSLELLNERGQLAFILPHKFFNAQYGEPLRKLLATGKHLRHVVHFGDQQIFPGATNYVCLLFLAKTGVPKCRFVRSDNLAQWLLTLAGVGADIPAKKITAAEWNFATGEGAGLFEKLQQMPVKLKDVAGRIFQGIIPGADKIYSVRLKQVCGDKAICYSRALESEVEIEKSILRPIISGPDVKRFHFTQSDWRVVYPYTVDEGKASLIPPQELAQNFPLAADYFERTRTLLDQRDGGSAKGSEWYRYIRTQNIGLQPLPKFAVPRLVRSLKASYDADGAVCLDNVDVGGITLAASSHYSPLYLLALLNSEVVNFFFVRTAAPFRGGFRSANRQFIEQLPIRAINFDNAADNAAHDAIEKLAEQVLAAKQADPAADTQALETEIDTHVFRLYALTPEEIQLVTEATQK